MKKKVGFGIRFWTAKGPTVCGGIRVGNVELSTLETAFLNFERYDGKVGCQSKQSLFEIFCYAFKILIFVAMSTELLLHAS